jgi:hypothetical protein
MSFTGNTIYSLDMTSLWGDFCARNFEPERFACREFVPAFPWI